MSNDTPVAPVTAKGQYDKLHAKRQPYLDRAKDAAVYTIPTLMPEQLTETDNVTFDTPWQSLGARGVNSLASKLLMALLPPNTPFFKIKPNDLVVQDLAEDDEAVQELDKALAKIERAVTEELEASAIRPATYEVLRQLIVAGNVLLHLDPKNGPQVYHLPKYVVRRNPNGEVVEIITRELAAPDDLPEVNQEAAKEQEKSDDKTIELYTRIHLAEDKWHVYQEAAGIEVPNTRGTYTKKKMPWMALRFGRIDGEHYGRGYVEELLGDLKTLDGLTQSITEGAASAAKVLFFLAPNSTMSAKEIAQAPNCSILDGLRKDIEVLQMEKFADFRVAREQADVVEKRLEAAFLLNASVQRDAERVTATEVRVMAGELDSTLSGTYSVLAQEFQLPLVKLLMGQMKEVPELPQGATRTTITTGMEALGRGHDLTKLDNFLAGMPQQVAQMAMEYLNTATYLERRATALGIDTKGLILSQEEIEAKRQQAQQQEMAGKLAGPGAKLLGDAMKGGMAPPTAEE